jgi:hypothetical protein
VGQSLCLLHKVQSCEEIVLEIVAEARQLLANAPKIVI